MNHYLNIKDFLLKILLLLLLENNFIKPGIFGSAFIFFRNDQWLSLLEVLIFHVFINFCPFPESIGFYYSIAVGEQYLPPIIYLFGLRFILG